MVIIVCFSGWIVQPSSVPSKTAWTPRRRGRWAMLPIGYDPMSDSDGGQEADGGFQAGGGGLE